MTDDNHRDPIRRGLATLIEETPVAPEFHQLTTMRLRPIREQRARRVLIGTLTTAAVAVTVVAGTAWVGGSGTGTNVDPLAVPEDDTTTVTTLADLPPGVFPRVLLDDPEWPISYVDHSEGVNSMGSFVVSNLRFGDWSDEVSAPELRLDAGSFADLEDLIVDRSHTGSRLADQPIWDTVAVIVGRGGSGFVAMWESNSVEYEFLAHDLDEESFRSLLESLTQVSEDRWLAALSDDIVTDRAAAVADYLADVPLPPGFDATSLSDGPIEHWYQVAAETLSAVACSWIGDWVDAKSVGDTQRIQQAVDAMATSHGWAVLADMAVSGDYPLNLWEYADAMAGDGTVAAGTFTTVDASYQRAFGCDG